MSSPPKPSKTTGKPEASRRQFLVHLDAKRIKTLKKAAIDLDRSASDIVDEAVQAWLEKFERRKG